MHPVKSNLGETSGSNGCPMNAIGKPCVLAAALPTGAVDSAAAAAPVCGHELNSSHHH